MLSYGGAAESPALPISLVADSSISPCRPPRAEDAKALFEPYLPCDRLELRRVYLRLAVRFHPDKWPEGHSKAATELFQAIGSVYAELLNPAGERSLPVKRVKTAAGAAAELGAVLELHRLLVERPSRAVEDDDNHVSPLMSAAKGGSIPCAELLLEYGADLHAVTPLGWTALSYAALHDNEEMVHFLVRQGLEVTENDLILAAYTGNVRGLQGLIQNFAGNVASVRSDPDNKTLLHHVCEGMIHIAKDNPERYLKCVDLLLASGVPVDVCCGLRDRGRTCLQLFVGHKRWLEAVYEKSPPHLELVRRLCCAGADPQLRDVDSKTAIRLATDLELHTVVHILTGSRSKL